MSCEILVLISFYYSTEKRVNDIVERLQNMGFVNDDQWLTSLVREKKADMNAVLDAIRFKVDH